MSRPDDVLKVMATMLTRAGRLGEHAYALLAAAAERMGLTEESLNQVLHQADLGDRTLAIADRLEGAALALQEVIESPTGEAGSRPDVRAFLETLATRAGMTTGELEALLTATRARPAPGPTRVPAPPQAQPGPPGTPSDPAAAGPRDPRLPPAAEDAVPAEWNVGDVLLDLYEVKQIHAGGMGKVYRIHHRAWNMDLAVKSPLPMYFATDEQKRRFLYEAETWVNQGIHPHLACCYYVRTLGGIPRLFAEYVTGGSLAEWIRDRRLYAGGPERALERILDVAIQFAWGLQYAHEETAHKMGLVHEDVKPGNLLLTSDGLAKVTDFGLARVRASAQARGDASIPSLAPGAGGLTLAYCSREQLEKRPLTPQTDIYSWAVSLLEMWSGEVTWVVGAFVSGSLTDRLESGPLHPEIPRIPPAVGALLARCLAERPQDRPRDMRTVADDLRTIYREVIGRAYPRQEPRGVELRADGLNNRAVSLLDLGRVHKAERLLEKALAVDPQHLEAVYNRGLLRWRSGRITDLDLVSELEAVAGARAGGGAESYLLGLVQLERGDAGSALEALQEAAGRAGADPGAAQALAAARAAVEGTARCLRVLESDRAGARPLALALDGRRAVAPARDGTLGVWDLETGALARSLSAGEDDVLAVAWAADGRTLLTGGRDCSVGAWDAATGVRSAALAGHTDWVAAVALVADGVTVLSGSADGTVRVWDLSVGRCVRTLVGHADGVVCVAAAAGGRAAVSGGSDGTLRVWDLATGECRHVLAGHADGVLAVACADRAAIAISGGADNTVRVWDLDTGTCVRVLCGHARAVAGVALTPDGGRALTGSWDRTVRVWDVASGKCLRSLEGHGAEVTVVALAPDGRRALSGSEDGTVRVWDLGGDPPRPANFAIVRPASGLELARAHEEAAAALRLAGESAERGETDAARRTLEQVRSLPGYERHPEALRLWNRLAGSGRRRDLRGGWHLATLVGHGERVRTVAISADGRWGLSAGRDRTLRVWDLPARTCAHELAGHAHYVTGVTMSADGRRGLSCGWDGRLLLWDLEAGKGLEPLAEGTVAFTCVALARDGRWALAGDAIGMVSLWDLATGRCLRQLRAHRGRVNAVAFAPDLRTVLTGGTDWIPRLWDLASGRCLREFRGHGDSVFSVVFGSDGRRALTASQDATLRTWDLGGGGGERTLTGHAQWVTGAALTPDGGWALSASDDRTIRVWDLRTGAVRRIFRGHLDLVTSLALTPDARWVLSGSYDRTVRLWELDWDLECPAPAEWDEKARPYLDAFLARHTPIVSLDPRAPGFLARRGRATWTEDDIQGLLAELGRCGLGWLGAAGIRRELERSAAAVPAASPAAPQDPAAAAAAAPPVGGLEVEAPAAPEGERAGSTPTPAAGSVPCAPGPEHAPVGEPLDELRRCRRALRRDDPAPEFAEYEILRRLGRGEVGAVYLARSRRDGQRVALKVLVAGGSVAEASRLEFLRRVEGYRRLRHRYVERILRYGCAGRAFWFVMEYCDAGSLAKAMARAGGRLPVTEAVALLLQALEGMAFAHAWPAPEGPFVHAALKPDNILIDRFEGRPVARVSDFGLVQAFREAGLGGAGVAVGVGVGERRTADLGFVAPEQVADPLHVGPACDVYALGATFYRVVTGCLPMELEAGSDPLRGGEEANLVPIAQRDPGIPAALAQVIERALARDVHARYANAGEMRAAVARVV